MDTATGAQFSHSNTPAFKRQGAISRKAEVIAPRFRSKREDSEEEALQLPANRSINFASSAQPPAGRGSGDVGRRRAGTDRAHAWITQGALRNYPSLVRPHTFAVRDDTRRVLKRM